MNKFIFAFVVLLGISLNPNMLTVSTAQNSQKMKDSPAIFNGGNPTAYIAEKLKLSKDEIGKGGQATVQFKVTKNGEIEGVKFLKSYSKVVDAKIYKVIKEMGAWTPAYQNGVAVDSYHTVPVILKP